MGTRYFSENYSGALLDLSNPLSRGLKFALYPARGGFLSNGRSSKRSADVGNPSFKGDSWKFNGTSDGFVFSETSFAAVTDTTAYISMAARFRLNATPASAYGYVLVARLSASSGNIMIPISNANVLFADTGNASANSRLYGTISVGTWYDIFVIKSGQNSMAQFWVNGVSVSTTSSGFLSPFTAEEWRIAHRKSTVPALDRYTNIDIEYLYIWDNQKWHGAKEALSVMNDPRQILVKQSRLWTATGGGGPTLITASDSLSLSITDASQTIDAFLAVNDAVDLSITDASQTIDSVLSVTDTLDFSITDASQTIAVVLDVADTVSMSITEAQASQLSSDVSDSLNLAISEATNLLSYLTLSDSLDMSITDVSSLLVNLAASDDVSMSVAEGLSDIVVALQLSDTLGISIDDAVQASFIILSRADDLTFSLTEQVTLLGLIEALDTIALSITDTAVKQLVDQLIARLTAHLSLKPTLSAELQNYPALSASVEGKPTLNGKEKVN